MKRLLIVLAALLFAGAWLGEAIIQDSGYVLIAYQNTSIETSLWVLLALSLIAFALFHWLINLAFNFRSPVKRIKQWRHSRHERKAGERAIEGLKAAAQGDWWRARRLLAQAAGLSSAPLIYYLEAARMASRDGNEKEVHRLLELANRSTPGVDALVKQRAAEHDLELGHVERAQVSLDQLLKQQPGNLVSKTLSCKALEQQGNWQGVSRLIPELRKANALSEDEARELRRKYAHAALEHAETLEALNQAWESLSYEAQQELPVKRSYIERLYSFDAQNRIETLLKSWLGKQWDKQLLLAYSRLSTGDAKEQLAQAKRWHKNHADDPTLELCLARLSRRNELWGAAIQHYRISLELEPSKEAELELAELYLLLDETQQASELLSRCNSEMKLPAPTDADRKTRLELLS